MSAADAAAGADGPATRHLVMVLGDQLDRDAAAFDGFDARQDRVLMVEADEESTHVWSAKPRTVMFLAAMRHFAQALRAEAGLRLDYVHGAPTLAAALQQALAAHRPAAVRVTEPGDWRVAQALRAACAQAGVPLVVAEDRHFFCSTRDFERHLRGRKALRMETFYREMRRRHDVLMEPPGGGDAAGPAGGRWNFDAENRGSFGRDGPGFVPDPARFLPDATTQAVIDEVNRRHAAHPGRLDDFAWPVTRAQALQALARFVEERLPEFGLWQDAMWTGQPWLWHAHLSAALNLKLLNPREVVDAAVQAWRAGRAPLASVEGFVRQILGWREYVRGVYMTQMPGYAEVNALQAQAPLPAFYWTGDTDMRCLADAIGQTLRHGYAHHIQRLMVTGLFALLVGVRPQAVHAWYLAVYVDAVEWVEMPNTLGMSQFADGGLMASKPYVAGGRYIQRMSDHCRGCRFDPTRSEGDDACPFTALYWDFLLRHAGRFATHPRLAPQVNAALRLDAARREAVQQRAAFVRETLAR